MAATLKSDDDMALVVGEIATDGGTGKGDDGSPRRPRKTEKAAIAIFCSMARDL
jgi:hypothetical protein